MMTTPFRQTGPTVVIIASPTALATQVLSNEQSGPQQYVITNTDTATDAFITFAANQGTALNNANVPSVTQAQLSYRVLHATQITLTGPQNAWVGIVSASTVSTARVEVTPGYGS